MRERPLQLETHSRLLLWKCKIRKIFVDKQSKRESWKSSRETEGKTQMLSKKYRRVNHFKTVEKLSSYKVAPSTFFLEEMTVSPSPWTVICVVSTGAGEACRSQQFSWLTGVPPNRRISEPRLLAARIHPASSRKLESYPS